MKIGITGSIACGKSTISGFLRELGYPVIDADEISHHLTRENTEVIAAIGEAFPGVVKGGTLDRRALGSRVFTDPTARRCLNDLLHPRILAEIREAMAREQNTSPLVFADIPLLYESGMDKDMDEVWVVSCSRNTQIMRLINRDGLSMEEALSRIASQMPASEKEARADEIISTEKGREAARQRVMALLKERCPQSRRRRNPKEETRKSQRTIDAVPSSEPSASTPVFSPISASLPSIPPSDPQSPNPRIIPKSSLTPPPRRRRHALQESSSPSTETVFESQDSATPGPTGSIPLTVPRRARQKPPENASSAPVSLPASDPGDQTVFSREHFNALETAQDNSSLPTEDSGSSDRYRLPQPHVTPVNTPTARSTEVPSLSPVLSPKEEEEPDEDEEPTPHNIPIVFRVALLLVIAGCLIFVSFTVTQQILHKKAEQLRIQQEEAEKAAHPLLYGSLVQHYSTQYNLDPALVSAIILCESSFRADAVSRIGARGLMQLMEETSAWVAHKLKEDTEDYSFDLLFDPEVNIRFGTWYLSYLSDRFGGNPTCMICAYHAGQGNVSSWLANPDYSRDGHTLDTIPTTDTATYCKRVLAAMEVYRKYYYPGDSLQGSETVNI